MTDLEKPDSYDPDMERILQDMLDRDEDITARALTRLHPKLSAASSITRNPARLKILESYQAKQEQFRGWRKRLAKRSRDSSAMNMAEKGLRIAELERQVELLTASHVAMLRAVGEMGGFAKWAKFFDTYKDVRDELAKLGAMPEARIIAMGKPHDK